MKIQNIEKIEKFTVGNEMPLTVEIKKENVSLSFADTKITLFGKLTDSFSDKIKNFFEMLPTENLSGFLLRTSEFVADTEKIEKIVLKSGRDYILPNFFSKKFNGSEIDFSAKKEELKINAPKIYYENDNFKLSAKISEINEKKKIYDININTESDFCEFEEIQEIIKFLKENI